MQGCHLRIYCVVQLKEHNTLARMVVVDIKKGVTKFEKYLEFQVDII
jgi:hypothetical protein